jgi:hypothetical protein
MNHPQIPYEQSLETIKNVCLELSAGDIVLVKAKTPENTHLGFIKSIEDTTLMTSNTDPRSKYRHGDVPDMQYEMDLSSIRALIPLIPQGPITGRFSPRSYQNLNNRDKLLISYNNQFDLRFRVVGFVDLVNPAILVMSYHDPANNRTIHPHLDLTTRFDAEQFKHIRTAYLITKID